MPKTRRLLAAAVLWLGGFSFVGAAAGGATTEPGSPHIIKVWGTKDGLPQSSVIAMTQTRDGYLWLGTLNGLVRFDGIRFTEFEEEDTPELKSSPIVYLFEDRQGNLWVGTQAAGVVLVETNGQVTSLGIGRGSPEGRLAGACEDASGAVWLYTANGELRRYWKGDFTEFIVAQRRWSACRSLIAEKSGTVWVGTDWRLETGPDTADTAKQILPVGKLDFLLASQSGGFWRLADGRVQRWKAGRLERDLGPYPWNSNALVSAACEDREGNLIVGTLNVNDGVYWYGADGRAMHISSAHDGLSHDGILSLCVDREGSLWVGTDGGGLNRVKRSGFGVLEESRGLTIQSVCEDNEGGLWIAWGGSAARWKDGQLEHFVPSLGPINLNVSTVFVDRSNRVWAGTRNGGLFQWHTNGFAPVTITEAIDRNILAIHQDRRGHLWLGTEGGLARWDERGWRVFTTRDGLSADVVRAIADDHEGNLWVGTDGGLNRLRDGLFTSFHTQDGLAGEKISSLLMDDEKVLWIGTDGGGLGRLNSGKWTSYTKREGLISNNLGYLAEDKQGSLWIGSYRGLMRVPKQALKDFADEKTNSIPCRTYSEADGLPTGECTAGFQPGAFRARNGTLWFPTIKGLVFVNPAHLKGNTNPPPVLIESVLIEGHEQKTNGLRSASLQTVTIPAGKERLQIHYTSLNLAAPDRARFRYRLEGHEASWTEAGDSRIARFGVLPPGDFRFLVTACNEDGVWNEQGATLAVTVLPPFWQTWWFRSATGVCLLGLIIGAVYYASTQRLQRQLQSLRQQEALEKERSRIARDLHDELGANLTRVALLGELVESDKDLPDEVEAHARQISQTARETTRSLDEIVWEANPSNDTLDSLVTYACKYAQEYLAVAGLRYRLDVPDSLPAATIPPDVRHNVFLAFKEAVNNVVKHAQATSVQVRLRLEPNRFTLEIEDNGRGLTNFDGKPGRNGLRNMRKRMEDIGGDFSIGAPPEGGTLIGLSAPVTKR